MLAVERHHQALARRALDVADEELPAADLPFREQVHQRIFQAIQQPASQGLRVQVVV